MIPDLGEEQWSLDGYIFGSVRDEVVLLEDGLDTGEADYRDQDAPHPGGDTILFGRDLRTPPTWTFTLGAVSRAGDVYGVLARFGAAWSGDRVRSTPGAVCELAYRRAGETRVVYGRPRAFTVETPTRLQHEFRVVTAQFQLSDGLSYSGVLHEVQLGTVHTTTSTGVVFPVVFPVIFGSSPGERAGWVEVASAVAAPFTVTITGPSTGVASGFRVASAGWVLDLPVTLRPGQTLTVDTATSVVAVDGVPVTTGIGRASNLSARIEPGRQEVVFTANDASATVTATIRWREAAATW